jgi:hypothetical protein
VDLKNLISTIKIVNIDADVLGSCHSLFLANHRSSNQITLMEKENLKLTNTNVPEHTQNSYGMCYLHTTNIFLPTFF